MMIDNPQAIRAHPTDESGRRMISDLEFMKELDNLAAEFTHYAEKAWKEEFHEKGNINMAKG